MKRSTKNVSGLIILPLTAYLGFNGVTDAESADGGLPHDRLLEKDGNLWQKKYAGDEEFDRIDGALRAYVKDIHPENQWNSETKKNEIKIYNFDAIAEERDA